MPVFIHINMSEGVRESWQQEAEHVCTQSKTNSRLSGSKVEVTLLNCILKNNSDGKFYVVIFHHKQIEREKVKE